MVRCEPHHSVTEVNETGNAKATSTIKTSAAAGVVKILEIYDLGNRVLIEVKIFQDWKFVYMSTVFDVLRVVV